MSGAGVGGGRGGPEGLAPMDESDAMPKRGWRPTPYVVMGFVLAGLGTLAWSLFGNSIDRAFGPRIDAARAWAFDLLVKPWCPFWVAALSFLLTAVAVWTACHEYHVANLLRAKIRDLKSPPDGSDESRIGLPEPPSRVTDDFWGVQWGWGWAYESQKGWEPRIITPYCIKPSCGYELTPTHTETLGVVETAFVCRGCGNDVVIQGTWDEIEDRIRKRLSAEQRKSEAQEGAA